MSGAQLRGWAAWVRVRPRRPLALIWARAVGPAGWVRLRSPCHRSGGISPDHRPLARRAMTPSWWPANWSPTPSCTPAARQRTRSRSGRFSFEEACRSRCMIRDCPVTLHICETQVSCRRVAGGCASWSDSLAAGGASVTPDTESGPSSLPAAANDWIADTRTCSGTRPGAAGRRRGRSRRPARPDGQRRQIPQRRGGRTLRDHAVLIGCPTWKVTLSC